MEGLDQSGYADDLKGGTRKEREWDDVDVAHVPFLGEDHVEVVAHGVRIIRGAEGVPEDDPRGTTNIFGEGGDDGTRPCGASELGDEDLEEVGRGQQPTVELVRVRAGGVLEEVLGDAGDDGEGDGDEVELRNQLADVRRERLRGVEPLGFVFVVDGFKQGVDQESN